jgi:uncharacterized membrane-anchored protein YitT (DUF2179 family)
MTAPAPSETEELIVTRERLRLLAWGFYVKGAMGALFVSFFLIHFVMLLAFSFMPEASWNPPPKSATTSESSSVTPSPRPRPVNQGPPVIILRVFAAVIGLVILLGWTFGGLTIYAGRCVQKRTHRLFIYIMAALNCALIPWGTLLGIATFYLMQSPAGRREFGLPEERHA